MNVTEGRAGKEEMSSGSKRYRKVLKSIPAVTTVKESQYAVSCLGRALAMKLFEEQLESYTVELLILILG